MELQQFGGHILSDDDSLGDAAQPKFFDAASEAMAKFDTTFRVGNNIGELFEEAG